MSRSYNKYPISRYEKADKKATNKWFRRHPEVEVPPKGNHYKKVKQFGWDAKAYWSKKEAIDSYYEYGWDFWRFNTLEDFLNWYEKCALRK